MADNNTSPANADIAAQQAPGFLHVVGSALSSGVGLALVGAALTAAVAVGLSFIPGGVGESVSSFFNTNLNSGARIAESLSTMIPESVSTWIKGVGSVGVNAAIAGAIGGGALGMLGGSISGTGDIATHYKENVMPLAEQQALQVGREIGGREREQQMVSELQNAAQEHQAQAESLFKFREMVVNRNPRYAVQLDKDKQLAGTTEPARG